MKQQGFSKSLRLMKVKYGLRFVVSKATPEQVVLIVLSRKVFDSRINDFLSEDIVDCIYDTDGRLISFHLEGVEFILLSKEGCG
ncbi:MAG: hypothetical protein H7844_10730 [Nitrospirae bacterium YQR-1]